MHAKEEEPALLVQTHTPTARFYGFMAKAENVGTTFLYSDDSGLGTFQCLIL